MGEGSWVGLDVHARSVVAGVIDAGSAEVRSLRLPSGCEATVAWLQTLPAPVRVVYEAGPTGYRLARACAQAGISCVVAAPSRIRAASDRVKTDRRDAERLARLLRLGEIAAELGDINRFPSPRKLAGYSGLCPRVYQSGERDLRGPLSKQGPRYLRWALVEAATHACTHPVYRDRYQQTKARIGKQRGTKVAQIDLARRLAEAIWHMLSREQPFAPKGTTDPLAA
jgi:transposase